MKVYPKIPRYDHPVVPDDFFDADDLVVVEKFDGSAFRFTLYEERYADAYPNPVVEAADGDGSLVFGTRRSIIGCHRDALAEIDGALHRAVRCLRDGVDTDALRRVHDEYAITATPSVNFRHSLVSTSSRLIASRRILHQGTPMRRPSRGFSTRPPSGVSSKASAMRMPRSSARSSQRRSSNNRALSTPSPTTCPHRRLQRTSTRRVSSCVATRMNAA
jgi:hypothetical protein